MKRVKNFLFHRVTDETDKAWPPMKPALFDYAINHLNRNYTIVALEHFIKDPTAFSSSTKPLATISFDDGYKDNIVYAAPILEKYKAPASFYVVTDCIDRDIPTWTFLVDHFLQYTGKSSIEFSYDFVPEQFRTVKPKDESVRTFKPFMKKLQNRQRALILRDIMSQCNDVEVPEKKMMNWQDVNELKTRGFVIGSHSLTHPMLASIEDETEIEQELHVSAKRIVEQTGVQSETISYPIGSFDERVIRLAKKTGYRYGLAVKQAFWKSPFTDVYEIPRVELYNEPVWKLRMRISGMYAALRSLVK